MTTQRFTSVDQAAIYVVGRLEGLGGSTRFSDTELSTVIREELKEIAVTLSEAVKAND